jgi:membrane-associated progesterone receptor component
MTISHAANKMGEYCDAITGVEGSSGYVILLLCTIIGYIWVNDGFQVNGASKQVEEEEEEEEPDPVRNFTMKQLRHFDGKNDENMDELKPVYLSLGGTVFDVSKGRDFYGPGGPYEQFAGRECGVALATMSFDEELLDDLAGCETLGVGDKGELENWQEKFEHYRCYPIKGRLVPDSKLSSPDRIISMEELAKYDGMNQENPTGDHLGYATYPIYVGAMDKVYDMSFGGVPMYGKDGPYNKFAGKDVSRALALMSFDPKDVENTDISDLEEKKVKILKDWMKTFEEKKGYPIVGKLDKKF